MKTINLTVNGQPVRAEVEPRTHLADFLREQLRLTGTHIGCEHGICGACTVDINGEMSRSCITFAVQCDGAEITTIEGFADDPLMARLREAFTSEHALQCGYCTPGMIVAARDLIRRKGQLDAEQIRYEMSGNLCRCTGYTGIVAAVAQVMAERDSLDLPPAHAACIGPAPGPEAKRTAQNASNGAARETGKPDDAAPSGSLSPAEAFESFSEDGLTLLTESFDVPHDADRVWAFLGDLDTVASCLPGARITQQDGDLIAGEMRVKLGPMTPRFAGEGMIRRDDGNRSARIVGHAKDTGSASRARGRIVYALHETDDGTRIEIEIGYALTGVLAQFSRGSIATDLVGRLTRAFADNLQAAISGNRPAAADGADDGSDALDAGGLLGAVVWGQIKSIFAALFGRRK